LTMRLACNSHPTLRSDQFVTQENGAAL
jgi:hypothetical protein